MEDRIQNYAKLGLVHHMLYPECLDDPDEHARSLAEFAGRDDIETFDCCIPYGEARRQRVTSALKACGKDVVCSMHLFPVRKISLASTSWDERGLIRLAARDQIEVARGAGARGFVFASGADVPEPDRPRARRGFAEFCRWFCGELKGAGITALLEPFDRTVDKKFLYGPTAECVELIRSLQPDVDNFAIELDVAHLPLMGESFGHAIRTTAPYLERVHLGNCVLKDPSSPLYGDQHPPIGVEGGEIDVPELAEILALLLQVGYLDKDARRPLVLEMKPLPGSTAEETVADGKEKLREAWKLVS